jgi:hypothetical protein
VHYNVASDLLFNSQHRRIVALANRQLLPAIYPFRARPVPVRSVSTEAACLDQPPTGSNQNASHSELSHNDPTGRIASARLLDRRAKISPSMNNPG